jgi:hypothetical protein
VDRRRAELAIRIADHPRLWQKVIHGESLQLRKHITRVLCQTKPLTAVRYAMCGLGDQIVTDANGSHVSARGCGHKLCPRCGRRRGGKYSRRIMEWLAWADHGDLLSICLTQAINPEESPADAKRRMEPKVRDFMRWLDGRGMFAAMTVVHLTWSPLTGGYHYHTHVLVEMPRGEVTPREMLDHWGLVSKLHGEAYTQTEASGARMVASAGPAITDLRDDDGDTDFWSESASAVARSVQYPMRDIAQGVSAWRLGGDEESMARVAYELVTKCAGWKMFRAWGRWRKACPLVVKEAADEGHETGEEGGDDAAAAPGPARTEGRVHDVWKRARGGDPVAREAFRRLEASVRNVSDFARRFVMYCRAAWAAAPPS